MRRTSLLGGLGSIAGAVLLIMTALSSGCHSDSLSRSQAKRLLEPLINQKQWKAKFGEIGPFDAEQLGNGPAFRMLAEGGGQIVNGGSSQCPMRLTDKGAEVAKKHHYQCESASSACGGGKWVISCAIPLTTRLEVEVTGITQPMNSIAEVDYSVTGVLSEMGKEADRLSHAAGGLGLLYPNSLSPRHGHATFRLYDDGWRVESLGRQTIEPK